MPWTKTRVADNSDLAMHSKKTRGKLVTINQVGRQYESFGIQQQLRGKTYRVSKIVGGGKKHEAIVINRKYCTVEPMTNVGMELHVKTLLRELEDHPDRERVKRDLLKIVTRLQAQKFRKLP